jgi:multiple sugar transport system permease protein
MNRKPRYKPPGSSTLNQPHNSEFKIHNSKFTQRDVDEGFSRWTHDLLNVSHHALTVGAALLFVVPLLWMLGTSLRSPTLPPPSQLEWIPPVLEFSNYGRVATDLLPFGVYLVNSLKVVAIAVPATIITASWAGFAMAQFAPRPRTWLIVISIGALMVPVTALWITRFIIYKWIGVLDTHWALVLPAFAGTSPFYVLLFYWTFTRIERDVYDSARLDGAGALRIWWQMAMPLSKPAITAIAVLSFVFYWSNFLDPLLYINSTELNTLPVGLQALQQMSVIRTNYPLLMAGAVMITLPVIVMFMAAQRFFLQDSRGGAGWLGR